MDLLSCVEDQAPVLNAIPSVCLGRVVKHPCRCRSLIFDLETSLWICAVIRMSPKITDMFFDAMPSEDVPACSFEKDVSLHAGASTGRLCWRLPVCLNQLTVIVTPACSDSEVNSCIQAAWLWGITGAAAMEVRDGTLTLVPVIMCKNNTLPAACLRAAIIRLTLWGGDPIPSPAAGTPHGIIMIQSLSRGLISSGSFYSPNRTNHILKEQKAASHTDTGVFMKARLCWANAGPKSQNWTQNYINELHKWLFYSYVRGWKGHFVGQSEMLASLHVRVELNNNNNRIWVLS